MSTSKYVQAACDHHSTLNAFASVVLLMEGAITYDPASNATSQKIIRLCKAEEQRQLRKLDAAIALAANEKGKS